MCQYCGVSPCIVDKHNQYVKEMYLYVQENHELKELVAKWRDNVKYLLSKTPNEYKVRVCEGGGPEDLLSSLTVTYQKMLQGISDYMELQHKLDKKGD